MESSKLENSGEIKREENEEYKLPTHKTPFIVQEIQRWRDKFYLNIFFAEAFGSFSFVFFLLLSVGGMELTFSGTNNPEGNWTTTILVLSMSVTLAIHITAPISGGHLSPASVFSSLILRGFPLKLVPLYFVAQFVGALFASICVYGILAPYLSLLDKGVRGYETLGFFVNTPDISSPYLTAGDLFIHEFLGCVIFNFIISGITDTRNPFFALKAVPSLVGVTLYVLASSFGWINYVLNPFRDFVPRLYLNAYYPNTFKDDNYWAIALFVPFAGNFFGMLLYDVLLAKNYVSNIKLSESTSHLEVKE